MTRFSRLIQSVASGYLVLIATALYALVSVPLALVYLSREQFGLWALMATIGGYLNLIDLGMSGSVARLLIDHKDERQSGAYGSLIKTGWLVLAVQAIMVFLAAFLLAPLLFKLAAIDPGLSDAFIGLLRWQGAVLAMSFLLRIFSHLLQAHQRIDVQNYSQIAALALNLVLLGMFFRAGAGVFSMIWASLFSALAGSLVCALACWKLRLFPPTGAWGRASWHQFREIFAYGKDLFLVAAGTQLIMTSQTILITRRLGLEAAAAWSVGTRTFTLVCQAIWRIMLYSGPALSEMIVRQERQLLRQRFKDIVILCASSSAFAAITFAACNSLFINLWTSLSGRPPIIWPAHNDVLLGLWMIVLSVLNCHNNLVLITKQIGFMRYIYFLEGCVFVLLAWWVSGWGGLPAVIGSSVVCSAIFTCAYGLWRTSRYFDCPIGEVAGKWLTPMAKVILFFAPLALLAWQATKPLNDVARLIIIATVCATGGGVILLRVGLPPQFREEILGKAPSFVSPVIRCIFKAARIPERG